MICKKCGKEFSGMEELCPKCRERNNTMGGIMQSFSDIFEGSPLLYTPCGASLALGKKILRGIDVSLVDPQTGNFKEEVKNKVRENFGVGIDEEVVFVNDSSRWKSRDRGVVVTDKKVYYCIDDDGPYYFSLDRITNVEYKDLNFIFSFNTDEVLALHVKHFIDVSGNSKSTIARAEEIAAELSKMAAKADVTTGRYNEICDEYNNLLDEKNIAEALNVALNAARNEGFIWFYYYAAQCADELDNYGLVITLCDEGLPYCEDECELETRLFLMKYEAQDMLEMSRKEVRKHCLPVMLNATDDMLYCDENLRKYAQTDFEEYDNDYATEFLQQPYSERKLLVPVKQYTDLMQNELSVLDIRKLPQTGIEFPMGHPKPYQLYVGHPSQPQQYIPFEDYELEFVKDKLREFCYFAQCLGATEIHIGFEDSTTNDHKEHKNRTISGELSKTGLGKVGGSYQNERTKHIVEEISNSMELHQLIPATIVSPHLPEDLVWYPHESSWQKLYKQRMRAKNGLSHTEKIQTSKSRVLDNAELTAVKGEFESIYISGKGAWDQSKDESFSVCENVTLTINVTFAPIEGLDNYQSRTPAISSYADAEREYIEELKACLEEDGVITSSERRLLDKLRKKLGISTERANQLEENLAPQLTEEEKEYLEDVKSCVEDGRSISQLSNAERRLLEKSRISLNISEERARELENSL